MSQYQPHEGGQQPNVPPRDPRGVQQFAAATELECPNGMIFDPALGTCIAEPEPES
ncbi:hypothetical protein OG496_05265 [Streptomyces sp. NBC_00988]|uniref:hypothetical protein n=1 Tax=Streptomyces sp. NBC_00988 TaxID=2903704 RepID=UPI003867B91B|nr:hypothetical protein OG496_05265 [Streptomyces sp. NBC_00988]